MLRPGQERAAWRQSIKNSPRRHVAGSERRQGQRHRRRHQPQSNYC